MSPKQKKTYIAGFLFTSCLLLFILLFNTSRTEELRISDLVVLDSMIVEELQSYSIMKSQIKAKTIKTGDFSRVYFDVRLPKDISKTQIHADLNNRFNEFEIRTPARLVLPEKELSIHLYVNNTIIRTIQLRTDTSIKVQKFNSTIAFLVESSPSKAMLEQVRDLGEFAPIVLRTLDPSDAEKWYQTANQITKPIYAWINEPDRDDVVTSSVWLKDKLPQFNAISKNLLLWIDYASASKQDAQIAIYRNNDLKALKLDHVVYFNAEEGIYAFEQSLRKFKQLAKMDYNPILMVAMNNKSLSVIEERTIELKKLGIRFNPPVFRDL